jgi:hypothetical protein
MPRVAGHFLHLLADWTGLEPATSAVTGRHSNQLNYQSVSPGKFGSANLLVFVFTSKKVNKKMLRPVAGAASADADWFCREFLAGWGHYVRELSGMGPDAGPAFRAHSFRAGWALDLAFSSGLFYLIRKGGAREYEAFPMISCDAVPTEWGSRNLQALSLSGRHGCQCGPELLYPGAVGGDEVGEVEDLDLEINAGALA